MSKSFKPLDEKTVDEVMAEFNKLSEDELAQAIFLYTCMYKDRKIELLIHPTVVAGLIALVTLTNGVKIDTGIVLSELAILGLRNPSSRDFQLDLLVQSISLEVDKFLETADIITKIQILSMSSPNVPINSTNNTKH